MAGRQDARAAELEPISVLSQIGRAAFPAGSTGTVVYYLLQAFTLAILVLAANTSYQGFPRLAALLARDKFLPRQFGNLGDRLVFSNGILILAAFAAVADRRLRRERELADPPVRDRRLHRLHAGADGDGQALVPPPGGRWKLKAPSTASARR